MLPNRKRSFGAQPQNLDEFRIALRKLAKARRDEARFDAEFRASARGPLVPLDRVAMAEDARRERRCEAIMNRLHVAEAAVADLMIEAGVSFLTVGNDLIILLRGRHVADPYQIDRTPASRLDLICVIPLAEGSLPVAEPGRKPASKRPRTRRADGPAMAAAMAC